MGKKLKEAKRPVGRPRMQKHVLDVDLHIRLSVDDSAALKAFCKKTKRTKTDVVREGLRLLGVLP